MKYESVNIKIADSVNSRLSLYIHESYPHLMGERRRPLVLICPGGGYEYVSPREAEPVAMQFLAAGCNAAVLWYDTAVQGVEYPQHLLELTKSVIYVREHSEEFDIDANKIIVAGFSAGAHLAACLGCFWHEEWLAKQMGEENPEIYKPNGLILAYPVITAGDFAHIDSYVNVMGSRASIELEKKLSLEKQVTNKVPPVFMWHTFEDESVPLENSLLFAEALRRADVNFEYHVFPHGGHGYALATRDTAVAPNLNQIEPQCQQWMPLCINWIKYKFPES